MSDKGFYLCQRCSGSVKRILLRQKRWVRLLIIGKVRHRCVGYGFPSSLWSDADWISR